MLADQRQWRRASSTGQLWQGFFWLGRTTDQIAGAILNPLVVALYARALEPDLVRLSWIVSAFALAWLAGSLISPWLQRLTVRVTPWVVGAYIVRTSSAALLAYAVSERSSDAEQRFRSVLICLTAYALATGVARSAHARQLTRSGLDLSPAARGVISQIGLSVAFGVAALALFRSLSATGLGWSESFSRIFALAAVALGVSTLAAIKRSAAQRDVAESAPAPPVSLAGDSVERRTPGWNPAALLGIGLIAVSFIEIMIMFLLFQDFRRQSVDIRTTVAFYVAGWAAGALVWGVALRRYTGSTALQASLACASVAMIAAFALRDLSRADWFPAELLGRDPIVLTIHAIGIVIGLAASGRREAALAIRPVHRGASVPAVAIALIGGITPMVIAWLSREIALDKALAAGIALTLLVLIVAGLIGSDGAMRRLSPALTSRSGAGALVRR